MKTLEKRYLLPFALVSILFLLCGLANNMTDTLLAAFKKVMKMSDTETSLIQFAFYGSYFCFALPAALFIRKVSYKAGIILGLLLYAGGAMLFYPAALTESYLFYLIAIYILAGGCSVLETTANPYILSMGTPETATRRLNIAQSFNGLGCMMGALMGGQFFFGNSGAEASASIAVPYTVIAVIMLVVAVCFTFIHLPEVIIAPPRRAKAADAAGGTARKALGVAFFFGFAALIAYEISEISINTFFINFMTDDGFMTPMQATWALSMGGLLLFMVGRVVGGILMSRVATEKIFLACAIGTVAMLLLAMSGLGLFSKMALIVLYVFESIMFPTIFALSIQGLGANTEKASSILMMSVVGGAIGPLALGYVADHYTMTQALVVPLSTFVIVLAYAIYSYARRSRA